MDFQTKAHSVYLLTYHIVIVTKYRKPVISDAIGDFMKNHAAYLCGRIDGELISAETDRDHMHLLVSLPPQIAPSGFIRTLKTQLSKEIHQHPVYCAEVKKQLYEDASLWTPSYFVATTGSTVMEKVKDYINSQRTDEHKRKYEKTGKYKKSQRSSKGRNHKVTV